MKHACQACVVHGVCTNPTCAGMCGLIPMRTGAWPAHALGARIRRLNTEIAHGDGAHLVIFQYAHLPSDFLTPHLRQAVSEDVTERQTPLAPLPFSCVYRTRPAGRVHRFEEFVQKGPDCFLFFVFLSFMAGWERTLGSLVKIKLEDACAPPQLSAATSTAAVLYASACVRASHDGGCIFSCLLFAPRGTARRAPTATYKSPSPASPAVRAPVKGTTDRCAHCGHI